MKIPFLPDSNIVDKNLNITARWRLMFIELLDNLRKNLSDEGFNVPLLDDSLITNPDYINGKKEGTLVVNKTTKKLLIKLDGEFKEVLT